MDKKQLASAYAVAKICGYDKPVDDFKELYNQYYSETLKEISEKSGENKSYAAQRPQPNKMI